ncbi:hypothetical protein D3C75_994530 [compost metagenome]
MIRLGEQPIAYVVEQGDECAHQQEGFEEQPGQTRVLEVHDEAIQQAARVERLRPEIARFGQHLPEHQRCDQGQTADGQHCRVPTDEVDQHAGDQPTAHAADGIATDIQAHSQADVLRVDFFTQVGHRHSCQAAQRQADQRPRGEYAFPGRHHCADHGR